MHDAVKAAGPGRLDPCPLCGSREAVLVATVPYEVIWRGLREQWSARFDDEVIRRHQPAELAELVRCSVCALEYFTPLTPGDATFYGQLMSGTPYHERRWEFDLVRSLIPRGCAIADLGCGDGGFLRSISEHAGRAVGVDHNVDAIAALADAGFEAYHEDFTSFAEREAGSFDVVSSFHTLEHLAAVGSLVGAARRLLRRNGRVFLSVPNRERSGRRDDEPMDCPPHHVSRWSAEQLRVLADRSSLELVRVWFEEPDLGHVWQRARDRARPWLDRIGATEDDDLATRAWMRLAVGSRRFERASAAGRFTARGILGHAMLAELRG